MMDETAATTMEELSTVLEGVDPDDLEFMRFTWLLSMHYGDMEAYHATEEDRDAITKKYGPSIIRILTAMAVQMHMAFPLETERMASEVFSADELDAETVEALMCTCDVCVRGATFH